MSDWLVTADIPINEKAIAQNATIYGPGGGAAADGWVLCKTGTGFNIWYYMTSAGAPTVNLTLRYTLFRPGHGGTHDPDSTARANYRTVTLGAALAVLDAWTHIDTPAEIRDYPFVAYQIVATENNVAAVTTLSVAIARNGSGPC